METLKLPGAPGAVEFAGKMMEAMMDNMINSEKDDSISANRFRFALLRHAHKNIGGSNTNHVKKLRENRLYKCQFARKNHFF